MPKRLSPRMSERRDFCDIYGAYCDGGSHPLNASFGNLAAAQAKFPGAGLTAGTWAATEYDTAAWLQCESDLRGLGGGVIVLRDSGHMLASQTLWLQDAGKVAFEGGRNTQIFAELCGANPVLRASNTSSDTSSNATGPAQSVPFRNLVVFAWNGGRAYFAAGAGAAAPGYATAAAMAGNPGGYRTGSVCIQIDDAGVAGQASVYATVEAVRWFNFDVGTVFGNNTFGIRFENCCAENNNFAVCWTQTAALNSMEGMEFVGGTYSNNNVPFKWVSTWTDGGGAHPQGGSLFIRNAHIDYNLTSQGVFLLAPAGNSYPQSSLHISGNHIENNAATLGAAAPWFTLSGVGTFSFNEIYINGAAPSTGLVAIGDGSSGSMFGNRIGGACPLFTSSTSGDKTVHGLGNTQQPVGSIVILLQDLNGTLMQSSPTAVPPADYYNDNCILTAAIYGNQDSIWLTGGCTKLTLPTVDPNSIRVGKQFEVFNTTTQGIVVQVPVGVFSAGIGSYADNRNGSATITGATIPANSRVTLRHRALTDWVFMGGYTASAAT